MSVMITWKMSVFAILLALNLVTLFGQQLDSNAGSKTQLDPGLKGMQEELNYFVVNGRQQGFGGLW